VTPDPPGGSGLSAAWASLREREFRRWFLSQSLSSSGTFTQAVGQAWLVIQLHGGGLALAVVTGATFVPTLLLGVLLGTLSDRYDRRRLLVATQTAQLLIAGTLAVLTAAGLARIWLLAVFALAMGVAFAVDAPARQIYVLDLVGSDQLTSAISLNEVAINASRVIGPAFGGIVIALTGVWVCFAVNALTFLPALAVLHAQRTLSGGGRGPVRTTEPSGADGEQVSRPSGVPVDPAAGGPNRIRDGWVYSWHTPAIRASLLLAVAAGAVYNIGIVVPLMAARVFHVGGGGYGAMLAAFGLGAVPGALLSAVRGSAPRGPEVRHLALAAGLVAAACAYAPTLWLLYLALVAVGASSIWFIARANAFVLLAAAPRIRGGVAGVWTAALPGMNPVTGLVVGAVAGSSGPRVAYAGAGVVMAALAAFASPGLRTPVR
jgi:MFS family permease